MYSSRPTDHELDKQLRAARTFLAAEGGTYANLNKAAGELSKLEIESPSRVWKLVLELLNEIVPQDYVGGKPPQRSYEKAIENKELFAFCWNSKKLGKKMYIKFALVKGRYYYVSLHESKER
jgi:hypothetical protein